MSSSESVREDGGQDKASKGASQERKIADQGMTWGGLILWSVLTVAVLAGGYFGYDWVKQATATGEASANPAPAPLVRTATARTPEQLFISQTGFTRPRTTLSISSEVTGRVAKIGETFRLGAAVEKGDLLFEIEQAPFRADVQQARARIQGAETRLEQANAELERKRILLDRNVSTEAVVDEAEAAAASAEAELALAKADLTKFEIALGDTVVTAPFDGVIASESISLGEIVQPARTLGELIASDYVEVAVGLTPAQIEALYASGPISGRSVEILDAVTNAELGSGTIDSISPNIDQSSRTRNVIIRIADPFSAERDPSIPVNALVRVRIPTPREEQNFVELPARSVKDGNVVWRIIDGPRLSRTEVIVIRRNEDRIVVSNDALKGGQKVLLTDLPAPFDGQDVRVRPESRDVADASSAQEAGETEETEDR